MNSSKEGIRYEKQIYNIVNRCILRLNGSPFNIQETDSLGGCGSANDIVCNWNGQDIPIEIKKKGTPDWMQCKLLYTDGKWSGSPSCRIPEKCRDLFERLIENKILFNGMIPVFCEKNITHEEWTKIKRDSDDFKDMYFDCPDDTIKTLYTEKGCKYIQISDKGLYHLGDDICGFNVPEFTCKQEMRIRTKIHTRKNVSGFCVLSVIIACKPININTMKKSSFSLDNVDHLPVSLQII